MHTPRKKIIIFKRYKYTDKLGYRVKSSLYTVCIYVYNVYYVYIGTPYTKL